MGRPTKWSQPLQDRICAYVRAGNFVLVAARSAGISHTTLYRWMQLGNAGRQPYRDFRDAVEKSEADSETALLLTINRAAVGEMVPLLDAKGAAVMDAQGRPVMYRKGGQWQAAFRLLESRAGDRWFRTEHRVIEEQGRSTKPPFVIQLLSRDREDALAPEVPAIPAKVKVPVKAKKKVKA